MKTRSNLVMGFYGKGLWDAALSKPQKSPFFCLGTMRYIAIYSFGLLEGGSIERKTKAITTLMKVASKSQKGF